MDRFLHAINSGQPDLPPVVRAAAAHLWFVTIHPFDDGNGRLARAITQLLLWRDNLPPLLIMSPDIHKSGRSYYQILERTQQGSLDISEWVLWFIACLEQAADNTMALIKHLKEKADFWQHLGDQLLNGRQREMLNALLDGLPGITAGKWAVLCRSSMETAQQDIDELIALGLLTPSPRVRHSIRYLLQKPAHSASC